MAVVGYRHGPQWLQVTEIGQMSNGRGGSKTVRNQRQINLCLLKIEFEFDLQAIFLPSNQQFLGRKRSTFFIYQGSHMTSSM